MVAHETYRATIDAFKVLSKGAYSYQTKQTKETGSAKTPKDAENRAKQPTMGFIMNKWCCFVQADRSVAFTFHSKKRKPYTHCVGWTNLFGSCSIIHLMHIYRLFLESCFQSVWEQKVESVLWFATILSSISKNPIGIIITEFFLLRVMITRESHPLLHFICKCGNFVLSLSKKYRLVLQVNWHGYSHDRVVSSCKMKSWTAS